MHFFGLFSRQARPEHCVSPFGWWTFTVGAKAISAALGLAAVTAAVTAVSEVVAVLAAGTALIMVLLELAAAATAAVVGWWL